MKKVIFFLMIVSIASCASRRWVYNDPVPEHDQLIVASKAVNEDRVINIWTPPAYEGTAESFPVLYMPDGGTKEDFPHIANTLAKLIKEQQIPPFILVGIENTQRGRDLTGSSESDYDKQFCPVTDGAKNFRAFITNELIPEVNRKYRTSDQKGIIGESLAGLFVMETLLLEPSAFDFYIAMDPSLWWNNQYLAKHTEALLADLPDADIKLWFAGSSAKDIRKNTRMVAEKLQENPPNHLVWKYSDEPREKHHTIFRATKAKALIWTLNN